MALSGLHVVAGYAGSSSQRHLSQPLLGRIKWSETLATAGTSALGAPENSDREGQPVFRLRSSADAWIAIGRTPNASASPRLAIPANTDIDIFVEPGERVAWVPA